MFFIEHMGSNPILRTAYLAKWIRQMSNKHPSMKATSICPDRLMDRPRGYEPRSEGSNPSRGAIYASVCLAARAADCKSATSETPVVQFHPGAPI